jgi:Arc/MetJ-type ribon-helix-helix transcriptional regulator
MASDGDEMVAFRLAPRDREAIRRLVEKGVFRNRSDFLRYAVKAALASEPEARPALNLDLEAVELPHATPAPSRRAARRAHESPRR